MERLYTRAVAGAVLIGAGALLLLQNLGFLSFGAGLIWALLFGVGGLVFLSVFLSHREHWWAVIPGFALLGLAGTIALGDLFPGRTGSWGGALFLGSLAVAFWVIYLMHPEHWWAIIPGGTLLTLALVAGLSEALGGTFIGSIFFLGLALTFIAVYLVPTPQGQQRWAIYPAAALGALALIVLASTGQVISLLWPLVLIAAGLYLVYRTMVARRRL